MQATTTEKEYQVSEATPVYLDKASLDEIIAGLTAQIVLGNDTRLTHTLLAGLVPMAGWKGDTK